MMLSSRIHISRKQGLNNFIQHLAEDHHLCPCPRWLGTNVAKELRIWWEISPVILLHIFYRLQANQCKWCSSILHRKPTGHGPSTLLWESWTQSAYTTARRHWWTGSGKGISLFIPPSFPLPFSNICFLSVSLCLFCKCMQNHFSHVWVCATPWTHQVPLSMGFYR